jgi:YfiH family protein
VHGDGVVVFDGAEVTGSDGDALVTDRPDVALAVFSADCAPVALSSEERIIGLVHAGWRGLVTGVLQRTVEVMRARGAVAIEGVLGPCIRAGCYEFGPADLDQVAQALGDDVRATTGWGTPALDLAAGVRNALRTVGVELSVDVGACTACSSSWFSARARGEDERQATLCWLA